MVKGRKLGPLMKARPAPSFRALSETQDESKAAAVGRTAYREEYERDRGPDADEWVDAAESGNEF